MTFQDEAAPYEEALVEYDPGGIRVAGTPLYLDGRGRREFCFISHAHRDHVGQPKRTLATDKTLRLLEQLGVKTIGLTCPFYKPFTLGKLAVELVPAGHILGAAQICIDNRVEKMVYTGDLSLHKPLTAEAATIVKCDTLVIEATYGKPQYVFPPREQVFQQIWEFADECFGADLTPVFLAYAIGKSQELVKFFGDKGYKLRLHKTIFDVCAVYRACGVELKGYEMFRGTPSKGEVVIFPHDKRSAAAIRKLERRRIAAVSGWAVEKGYAERCRADVAFPLSDHADFNDLCRYVERASPRKVLTIYGFNRELAEHFKSRGVNASPLSTPKQLTLF